VQISAHRSELGGLDRAIGDGDHGENLDRGFGAVSAGLEALPDDATPGEALKLIATILIAKVGGAAGPLYGTAFLRAAAAAGDRREFDSVALSQLLAAARDGIAHRGKAVPGDKTMIDAWSAAVDAASSVALAGGNETAVLAAAADAAEAGAVSTEPLVARKGRASYLGERAIGHRDPGAQSSAIILRAAADVARASM
jgi:dihydroxyacetone kinase-like protein